MLLRISTFVRACCIVIAVLFNCSFLNAQSQIAYAVFFTDKNNTAYSLTQPSAYLSTTSIDRRLHQQISIDSADLPIVDEYRDSVLSYTNAVLHLQSKWFNAIVILVNDTTNIPDLINFNFIKEVRKIASYTSPIHAIVNNAPVVSSGKPKPKPTQFDANYYGQAWNQIEIANGQTLHAQGYEGEGIHIAVIDCGFKGVDTIEAFSHLFSEHQLVDQYNFVRNNQNIFSEDQHGTQVLSTLAAYAPQSFVGTAPKAQYSLYHTEEPNKEQMIELYNFIAAAERADSVGVDIITASLGYNTFDLTSDDFTYADLDGNTTIIAKAVNMAFDKGIFCVVSAGNEGNTTWKYILTPADAKNAFTVGAVTHSKLPSNFTGWGFDLSSKPDVAGLGSQVGIINASGGLAISYGTSFSTPAIAGLIACYFQATQPTNLPYVHQFIKSLGHLGIQGFNHEIGTGIPDFGNALSIAKYLKYSISIYPNPCKNNLFINHGLLLQHTQYIVVNMLGQVMLTGTLQAAEHIINTATLQRGNYLLHIYNAQISESIPFIKD